MYWCSSNSHRGCQLIIILLPDVNFSEFHIETMFQLSVKLSGLFIEKCRTFLHNLLRLNSLVRIFFHPSNLLSSQVGMKINDDSAQVNGIKEYLSPKMIITCLLININKVREFLKYLTQYFSLNKSNLAAVCNHLFLTLHRICIS